MILESRRVAFLAAVDGRVRLALRDVVPIARRNLGGSGPMAASVHAVDRGPLRGLVGSSHPGAYAQEVGAYIRPVHRRALKFADGGYSARARIPAKHWLSRAGRQWGSVLSRRLRGS